MIGPVCCLHPGSFAEAEDGYFRLPEQRQYSRKIFFQACYDQSFAYRVIRLFNGLREYFIFHISIFKSYLFQYFFFSIL